MNEMDLITNRDIVIVGQQPWDVEIGSNCKNIAIELPNSNQKMIPKLRSELMSLRENRKP